MYFGRQKVTINHDATDEFACFGVNEVDGLRIRSIIDKHIKVSVEKSKTKIMENVLTEVQKEIVDVTCGHLLLSIYKLAESFTIIQKRQEDAALEEVALRYFMRRYAESQSKISFVSKSTLENLEKERR